MTFLHKMSARLAMMRDALLLIPASPGPIRVAAHVLPIQISTTVIAIGDMPRSW